MASMSFLPLQHALKRFYDTQAYHQQVREQYHTHSWMIVDADAMQMDTVQAPLIQQGYV